MKYLYTLFALAGGLDYYSTVIQQDWRLEENPLAKWFWQYYGDYGLLFHKTITTGIFILAVILINRYFPRFKWLTATLTILAIIFTTLIALTNLTLVGYEWLAWY